MFRNIEVLNVLKSKGFSVFTKGKYNVNIIGVRSKSNTTDVFNDELHLIYKDDDGSVKHHVYKITTDAGKYYLENPMNRKGTAGLVEGRYKFSLSEYKGYRCLRQAEKVKVYRDNDKDSDFDYDTAKIDEGYFGILIHRASSRDESVRIGKWSAGCQVFANPMQYKEFIDIIIKSAGIYGDTFSYTLINEQDILDYRKTK